MVALQWIYTMFKGKFLMHLKILKLHRTNEENYIFIPSSCSSWMENLHTTLPRPISWTIRMWNPTKKILYLETLEIIIIVLSLLTISWSDALQGTKSTKIKNFIASLRFVYGELDKKKETIWEEVYAKFQGLTSFTLTTMKTNYSSIQFQNYSKDIR